MTFRNVIIILVLASSWATSMSTPASGSTGLDALVRQDFDNFRDGWFLWLLVWTTVVAFGVILEGPELLHEVVGIFRRSEQPAVDHEGTPLRIKCIKVMAAFGWLLIVIGLVGEGVSEAFVSKADGFIQRFNDIELSATEKHVGEVNFIAAQANKEAEDEHLARVKLEKQIQPRTINESDRQKLADKLRPFAPALKGRKVKISSQVGDAEGMVFSLEIMDILSRAGIEVDASGMGALMEVHAVAVGTIVTGPPGDAGFIKFLVEALNAKLDPNLGTSVYGEWNPKYTEVLVMVGVKPIAGLPKIPKDWKRQRQ